MSFFPIVDVESEIEVIEYLGTKEKFWFKRDGKLQLLKFGREETGENWAEKIACELCQLLALPHAHYDFARFKGKLGVLTPKMNEDGSDLILGNQLMDPAPPTNEGTRYKYRGHTVSRVLEALKSTDDPELSVRTFSGYLMLDAWIGNGDRHNENWGLVRNPERRTVSLAPTFDHASSLGRELRDEVRAERLKTRDKRYSVEAYAARTRSGLYEEQTNSQPLYTINAFKIACSIGKSNMDFWLDKLSAVSEADVSGIFKRVPTALISNEASAFAIAMLEINKQKLLGLR
ncbi:hypothetical protein GCM10010520_58500 [Rhizobium viscosum]|uniref:HipA-like C-terminal domain-containing protein n=1 Tax=Rhizobium viscosum TaxID=1673 RepID=A0ABR9IT73_RHIVS|nr:HipA domain-containing protein [Rhizobium viscosum]MBE1506399.1 hypothetical protein [Rhizobium viscosum]